MIKPQEIADDVLSKYDLKNLHLVILGSHSAKEMGVAAKRAGFPTILFVQEGRDKMYTRHNAHLFDRVIKRPKFSQMADDDVQDEIREYNGIILPHRSFYVYVKGEPIENDMTIPIYGNRRMLRAEDRDDEKSQYYMMEKAGMCFPEEIKPDQINMPVIVKIQQKKKKLERAFFYARDYEHYKEEGERRINKGLISKEDLETARVERYVIGPRFNANFQRYALHIKGPNVFPNDYDFVGTGDRVQADIGGWKNLDAQTQLDILDNLEPLNEEVGHFGVTMRESLQPLPYEQAEKFIEASTEVFYPGIIGPLGVQGAIQYANKIEDGKLVRDTKLKFYVFDLSLRNSGDPHITATSPEMENLTIKHWETLNNSGLRPPPEWNRPRRIGGPLDLAMMELEVAVLERRLDECVT